MVLFTLGHKILNIDSARLEEILTLTRSVGWGAGDILLSYYEDHESGGNIEIKDKKDGPVTAADLAANHYILENLQAALGNEEFDYLSEETYKEQGEFPKPWVWVIDPLDGTRDFIQKTGEFAIHIALTYQKRPVLAVVVLPGVGRLYYATKGGGTFVETRDGEVKQITVSQRNRIEDLYLIASRSHRNQRLNTMLERIPFKEIIYCGSVGCKISTILEQRSDVYVSLSGKSAPKDWDFAAPELILTEAGGKFTNFDGEEILYNTGDVNQWGGLMASNGHCHEELYQKATAALAEVDRELAVSSSDS